MNCPCGEKAVSFGPFGNACPAHVPALAAGVAAAIRVPEPKRQKHIPALDASLCSCGARASRWYEGGASCWFCVPRRATQQDKVVVALSVAWQVNLGRVEAIARRTHRRRQVLGIAQQTKDQYPIALQAWELWQVAKVQEDGRLKDVLAKSCKELTKPERTAASTLLAIAVLSLPPERAEYLAELATKDLVTACREAGVACPATSMPVDPAPYFQGPADWDAAFYKALQTVSEDERMDVDACYLEGLVVVINQTTFVRGRAPVHDRWAMPGRTYYPK